MVNTIPEAKPAAIDLGKSFLEDVVVEHGPIQTIGRLLLTAESAARDSGVHLSFAPMTELLKVNAANLDTWRPLLPIFDPTFGDFGPKDAFCILGRSSNGDIVLTQAARFFDWTGTSFHDEATELRLFYGNPDGRRHPKETCVVTAPSARQVRGRVAYTGAHWCRPDFRSKGLPSLTPRIARALAVTYWNVDCTCSMMARDVFGRGVARRAGYPNVEWSVNLINNPFGTIEMALLWSDRSSIELDFAWFLEEMARVEQSSIQSRA